MKAFLINPIDETITEVDHDDSDYRMDRYINDTTWILP